MKTMKLPAERSDFPTLRNKVMLSSCSQSAPPQAVFDALDTYKYSLIENGMEWTEWVEHVEGARKKFAELISCDPEEVAILSSVSDAVSSVVNSLEFRSDENISVTEIDFPCIGQVALSKNLRQNVPVVFIPHREHLMEKEDYEAVINHNTKLTCVPHVSYYNGFKQDLKMISEITKRNGSLLFVDAYQSAGSVPINVKEMGVDILVAGLQKYLMGIPGITFLYIRKELSAELVPAVTGWFGQSNPFAFDLKATDYAGSTRRFNTGTPPIINAYAAEAALTYILDIGVENIQTYLQELSDYTFEYAEQLGMKVASPKNAGDKGATTAIYVEEAEKAEAKLKEQGIVVSARKDIIRIAPHVYNTKQDIKHALDHLKAWT